MSILKTTVGVAALTYARTETGGYAQIYAGDPVPDGYLNPVDQARLLEEGYLGVLEVEVPNEPDAVVEVVEFDPTKGGGVKETKSYVGDDPAKASEMLALEETRDTPRVTLVEWLEGIATEPADGEDGDGS